MYKKTLWLVVVVFFVCGHATYTYAQTKVLEFYDPYKLFSTGHKYIPPGVYDQYDRYRIYFADSNYRDAYTIEFASYTPDWSTKRTVKRFDAHEYGWDWYTGYGVNCNANYIIRMWDKSGRLIVRHKFVVDDLVSEYCQSQKEMEMTHDAAPNGGGNGGGKDGGKDGGGKDGGKDGGGKDGGKDGGGKDGSKDGGGKDGSKDGGGKDGGGKDGGKDGGLDDCNVCKFYRDVRSNLSSSNKRLDDILRAIPPPPDWQYVANTMRDTIVPRLVSDTRDMLDELLGRAPTPPPTPPSLPELDDRGIKNKVPQLKDSGVKGFDEQDIKNNAPNIQFEDDPTGGFDLSTNPVDNLPDVVPGGDPGPYDRSPQEPSNPYPDAPRDGDVDVGGAPIPSDNGGSPPTPDDKGGRPPIPDGNERPPNGYMDRPM